MYPARPGITTKVELIDVKNNIGISHNGCHNINATDEAIKNSVVMDECAPASTIYELNTSSSTLAICFIFILFLSNEVQP